MWLCLFHNEHIKVEHEGFKPHKCDQCQAAFSEKTGLKVHIANKHGDETFRCECCDKKFGVKGNMIRHVKNVHDILEVTGVEAAGGEPEPVQNLPE